MLAKNPLYQRYRLYLSSGALLLAHAYARSEDYTAAVPLIERAIAIRENILTQDPQNTQAKERLADAYRELCLAHISLRRFRQAQASARKAVALYSELQTKGNLVPLFLSGYADSLLALAQSAQALGQPARPPNRRSKC